MSIKISDIKWDFLNIDVRYQRVLEATWDMGNQVTWDIGFS